MSRADNPLPSLPLFSYAKYDHAPRPAPGANGRLPGSPASRREGRAAARRPPGTGWLSAAQLRIGITLP